jgi:valyl-tRNA synthetase
VDPDQAQLGPAERWLRSRVGGAVVASDRALAEFSFGELTRVLYDSIWGEFCDWALELAKVRLADDAIPAASREATWWTLVEALDTYLRLLHPVMPFVTEALWAEMPRAAGDPDLLIVADWPAAPQVDARAEADVGALLELVRALRNARSEAKLDPSAWLAVEVALPPGLGPTFDALAPALERLAHARPLTRVADTGALRSGAAGGLAVLAGPIEALIRPAAPDREAAARDRVRLERELAGTEVQLEGARARLADARFVAQAPPAVVERARARAAELEERVTGLRASLAG